MSEYEYTMARLICFNLVDSTLYPTQMKVPAFLNQEIGIMLLVIKFWKKVAQAQVE